MATITDLDAVEANFITEIKKTCTNANGDLSKILAGINTSCSKMNPRDKSLLERGLQNQFLFAQNHASN